MINFQKYKQQKMLNEIRADFYVAMPLDGDNSLMEEFMAAEIAFFNTLTSSQQDEYQELIAKRTLLNIHTEECLINFLLEEKISKNI